MSHRWTRMHTDKRVAPYPCASVHPWLNSSFLMSTTILKLAERLFNHAQRAFGDLVFNPSGELTPFHPTDGQTSSPAAQRTARHPAQIIDQHIVIFRSAPSRHASCRSKISKTPRSSTLQSGLFPHLAPHREIQGFAQFQRPAGQRPPAHQRLLAALRHQDAPCSRKINAPAPQWIASGYLRSSTGDARRPMEGAGGAPVCGQAGQGCPSRTH